MKRRAFLGLIAAAPLAKLPFPTAVAAAPMAVSYGVPVTALPAAEGAVSLTVLIPELYAALDIVSREFTGFAQQYKDNQNVPTL